MKKLALLLVLTTVGFASFGQKLKHESEYFDVYFGPNEKRELGTSVDYFLGADDEHFYTYFQKGRDVVIGKYSHELKKIRTKSIELPKEKVVRNIELHMELDDELYEFYSISDKKTKSNKLFCRTLDKEKLIYNKDDKELFDLKGDKFYKDFKNAFTQFDRSPDGSKFLIAFKLPEEEDRYRRFHFMVFDREFNLLWEKDEKFFMDKGKIFKLVNRDWVSAGGGNMFFRMGNTGSYRAFQLGNDGEIVTWGIQDNGREFEKEERFETYVFRITEKEIESMRVGFSDKKIQQYNIRLTNSGKVMISGFYNNDVNTRLDLIDGAFLSYWNVGKGEMTHASFDEFEEDFKTSYWSERKMKNYEKEKKKGKDRVGMDNYDLDYVIEK